MEELGSHQPTIGPHQDNDNPHQAASGGSQHSYSEANPQQRRDHEQSGQTMHTNRSQSHGKSHVSHAENEKEMQREINELKKKLRRARRRQASHVGLRVPAFLGDLINQLSLFIMAGQIQWSMLAILIKKWPSIQRMRP